jgi:hypothetical protein
MFPMGYTDGGSMDNVVFKGKIVCIGQSY